ncbi:unnamed protein product [Caenorhabditis bovis]|uniref:SXP/RAL-2 family protein Ani s 5-like cation-binding domain-containing protein n=1 Tax=Caenorhabditis bovis TaxID=2654633 RepID=A0A8S1FD40_9PELO|nr:unnamed protein product [Caenorhabditis bovis]
MDILYIFLFAVVLPFVVAGPPTQFPFLEKLTQDEKATFLDIFKNQNLTIEQIDAKKAKFAKEHHITEEYEKFEEQRRQNEKEKREKMKEIIEKLPIIAKQAETILKNKKLTKREQRDAIAELKAKNPDVTRALFFIFNMPQSSAN